MLTRVFKAFQYRNFRLMWLGACTSSIGTWMQKAAQAWLVLQISNSPFLLGLDAFLGELPVVALALVGGVVADRRDRRHLLLISQFIQMSCAITLAFLVAFDAVQVWQVLCLSFISGVGQAFGAPAYQALLPSLVQIEDVSNAIAMNSIQFNVARVVGPAVGAAVLTQLGAAWCFALNGASFLAVIAALFLVQAAYVPARTKEPVLESMREGIRYVRRRSAMPSLIGLSFAITMLGVPLVVFLPVFARDILARGPNTYMMLMSIYGAGSVGGALVVAASGHSTSKGRHALLFLGGLGAMMSAFAFSRTLVGSGVFLFAAGACLVGALSLVSTLVQELTEDKLRGRVMSVYNVAFRGGMPLGSLATGAIAPYITAPGALALNGALLFFVAAYLAFVQRRVAAL